MTIPNKALIGTGRFQWNAGAWFGASIGSTAWMLIVSIFLLSFRQLLLAIVPAACFAAIVAAALTLWLQRSRIYPFRALMVLLALLVIAYPLVWIIVATYGSTEAVSAMNWPKSAWATIVVSGIVPMLMLAIWAVERSAISSNKFTNLNSPTTA